MVADTPVTRDWRAGLRDRALPLLHLRVLLLLLRPHLSRPHLDVRPQVLDQRGQLLVQRGREHLRLRRE